jgi:hypothetical protein
MAADNHDPEIGPFIIEELIAVRENGAAGPV